VSNKLNFKLAPNVIYNKYIYRYLELLYIYIKDYLHY